MHDNDQKVVVNHGEGPLLVVAGAGSGKTTSIIGRAVRLIQEGLRPTCHLMLTFTRKAAEEMRSRIGWHLPDIDADELPIMTFHSFCWGIIRRSPALFGRSPGVTVLQDSDIRTLCTQLATELNLITPGTPAERRQQTKVAQTYLECYAVLRNEGGNLTDAAAISGVLARFDFKKQDELNAFLALAMAYEAHKARTNTLDFDDMVGLLLQGLDTMPLLRAELRQQYPFITVDESQDTNLPQFRLVERLASDQCNVVMVGDDDQAIYAWRGARPQNLRDFKERFNAQVAMLPKNYRSQRRIVESAGYQIAHNRARFNKQPEPMRSHGSAVKVHHYESGYQAGYDLADLITADLKRGIKPDQIAILFRTNRAANQLKKVLTARRIPHHVVNGMDFVEQAEIQLALAAARLATNPNDEAAFRRLCNLLPGVGEKAQDTLCQQARLLYQPILQVARNTKMSTKARSSLDEFCAKLEQLVEDGPLELVTWLNEAMDAEAHFDKKDKDPELTARRMDALTALGDMITSWLDGKWLSVEEQWQVFLESLLLDAKHTDGGEGKVWLSTVHQAKGLEWATVHVWGLSEGIFPLGKGDIEEERRLSYVALTRAKDDCHLWHAATYPDRFDESFDASSFLSELPNAHVEIREVERSFA